MSFILLKIARERNAETLRWAVERRDAVGPKSRSTIRDRVGWGLIRIGLLFVKSAETRRAAADTSTA